MRSAGTNGRPSGIFRQGILFALLVIFLVIMAGVAYNTQETLKSAIFNVSIFLVIIVGCGTKQPDEKDLSIWSRHDAHRFCAPAIAAYPDKPAPPCFAMHMCANEAVLNSSQSRKLLEMIAKTEGCEAP